MNIDVNADEIKNIKKKYKKLQKYMRSSYTKLRLWMETRKLSLTY